MIQRLKHFFLPRITKQYLIRVFIVTVCFFIVFKFVCLPVRVNGHSMVPTYQDGDFNFIFKLRYLISSPARQDVVAVRLAGERVVLLKRVVALQGDTVEFRNGVLLVNKKKVTEPYVKTPSDWDLPVRTVEPGHVYIVGDNRGVPIQEHRFGQTSVKRIVGGPLW